MLAKAAEYGVFFANTANSLLNALNLINSELELLH